MQENPADTPKAIREQNQNLKSQGQENIICSEYLYTF